jgi:hypothetical protein
MRDVTNDTPVARALALIDPPADQRQRCCERLSLCVEDIARDTLPISAGEERTQLEDAAKALQKALKALKRLPLSRQHRLLPPIKRAGSSAPLRLQDLISDPVSENLRLAIFLNDLENVAIRADLQAVRRKVPRSGGRPNYRKQAAAEYALTLLLQFGRKRPTLTGGGPFFDLASVLYEAATGKPDIDLSRQCRAAHKQLPHRTVEQGRK